MDSAASSETICVRVDAGITPMVQVVPRDAGITPMVVPRNDSLLETPYSDDDEDSLDDLPCETL
jgi:hypothetical protein